MDVRCSRCGTEYDFDDALVSERGTTVKCTNCGHQFKVYPGGSGGAPERWIVRKGSGRELVYTSLRDLQRAIAQRQVGPTDLLSRGGGQPLRTLASIAELEPFFQAQGPTPAATGGPSETAQRTLLGVAPQANRPTGEDTIPDQPPFDETMVSTGRAPMATPAGGFAAARRPAPPPPPKPSQAAPPAMFPRFDDAEPKTMPRNQTPEPMFPTEPAAPATLSSQAVPRSPSASQFANAPTQHRAASPPPPQRSLPAAPPPQRAPAPVAVAPVQNENVSAGFRAYQDSFSDESGANIVSPPGKPALRWLVGLVVLGGLAFIAGTVGVRYARQMSAAPTPSAHPADDRVQKLLEQGDAELSRGDFETAKEQYDKASALAERNSAVLSALARLEAARADIHWLGLKLIDPNDQAALDTEKTDLGQRVARVRKAADAAAGVAPTDPVVIRTRIDALRLGGEVARARELVTQIGEGATQPETAYVLAALDMAEASPAWPTIIDRLRTAASAERGAGRARAALVYALATSGSADDAKAELSKLEAGGTPNALVGRLRAYVSRSAVMAASAAPPGSAAPSASAEPAPSAAVAAAPKTPGGGGEAPPSEGVPRGMDFRKLLEDASAAKRGGDLARAEALYHAAQEQQPGNTEALAGLGDVARMRGDSSAAAGYYDAVLQQNPTYLPALVGAADMKWAAGNRAGALVLYKRIAGQADPGSPYGQRAAQRIAEAANGPAGSTPAPAERPTPPKPPSDTPKPKEHPDTPPNVDTSDLPGFK